MAPLILLLSVIGIGGAVGLLCGWLNEKWEVRRWSRAWAQVETHNVGTNELFGKGVDDESEQ